MTDVLLAIALLAVLAFAAWLRSEPGRRWHCRKTRHDARTHRAEPVIPLYFICHRCGRYARTLEELDWMR